MVLVYICSKAQGFASLLGKLFWRPSKDAEVVEPAQAAAEEQPPSLHSDSSPASAATEDAEEERRQEEASDHREHFQSHCRCSPKHLNAETFLLVPTSSGAYLSARHFVCPQPHHRGVVAARADDVPLAEQWALQQSLESTRLRRLRRRLAQLDIMRTYDLAPLVDTPRAQLYTITVGAKTHVVKLTGNATALLRERCIQNEVVHAMHQLWHLSRAHAETSTTENRPVVPRATYLVSSEADETGKLGFVMDCIMPLRDPYRSFLARKYIHPDALVDLMAQPGWETLSLQPHMGETRPELDELSTRVRDRPVYLDTIFAERGARGVRKLAASLGATLAILHWGCQLDARGVKFQFGSAWRGNSAVWLCSFGDCANFDPAADGLAARLAEAVARSPFWPRPPWAHGFGRGDAVPEYVTLAWGSFAKTYLRTSRAIAEFVGPNEWMPEPAPKNGGRLAICTEFIQLLKEWCRSAPGGPREPCRGVPGPQVEGD